MDKNINFELYKIQPGNTLSQYECKYLLAGIIMTITSPIQIILFFKLVIMSDGDIIFMHPLLWLFGWLIVCGLTYTLTCYFAAGCNYKLAKEFSRTLGLTGLAVFAFHAGIIMVSRIIFIYAVRKLTNKPEFRKNHPYILYQHDFDEYY